MRKAICFIAIAVVATATAKMDYAKNGGMLKRPDTQQGRILFIDAQKRTNAATAIRNAAELLERQTHFEINVEPGDWPGPNSRLGANEKEVPPKLYIIDSDTLPRMLAAPEDKWAAVNVAGLEDSKGRIAFFTARVEKEISRGFAILCGAFQSQFQRTLTDCITSPEKLDRYPDGRLPFDAIVAIRRYMEGYGVKPYEPVSYADACMEGWAPAPTNDVQKAIWDKVHAIPKNPMKIEFDPKKGR